MKSWKVILATLVIYAAGIVSGGLVANQYQERLRRVAKERNSPVGPWAMRRMDFLGRIDRELTLGEGQRGRIGEILKESHERCRPVREKFESQMREEMREVREKIRAELDPHQRERFDELMKLRGQGDKRPYRAPSRNPQDGPGSARPVNPSPN